MIRPLISLIVLTSASLVAMPQEPKGNSKKPQWQRMLTGADARKAEQLERRADEAKSDEESMKVQKELIALRTRVQGEDHWETISARVGLNVAEKVVALPDKKRAQFDAAMDALDEVIALHDKGKFRQAIPLAEKAIKTIKELLGEKNPNYSGGLNNLSSVYQGHGLFAKAEEASKESIRITNELFGPMHPEYAASISNLAAHYLSQGALEKAEPLLVEASRIQLDAHGDKHTDYGISLNNLAEVYRNQGFVDKADPLLKQSLEISRKAFGERSTDYATSLNNLALLYSARGDLAKAEPLLHQAVDVIKKAEGEHHPSYSTCLVGLAGLYVSQGQYSKAEPLLVEAVRIDHEVLGGEHPDYAHSLDRLAKVYLEQQAFAKAEPLLHEALRIRKFAYDEKHPAYAEGLTTLGGLFHLKREYKEAESKFIQAKQIRKDALGETHPDYANSVQNLASLYSEQRQFDKAEPLQLEAIRLRKVHRGVNHLSYANSVNSLAGMYVDQGHYAKAEPLFQEAKLIRKRALGDRHGDYYNTLHGLAFLYFEQGKYKESESVLREATECYEASRLAIAAGIGRAEATGSKSLYDLRAVVEARLGKPWDAARSLELDLARGLLDEQSGRSGATLTKEEQQNEATIRDRSAVLQGRILYLATRTSLSDGEQKELDSLIGERNKLAAELSNLAAAVSQREVVDVKTIQAALPADAAFVVWIDFGDVAFRMQEHWAYVLRSTGEPHWERLPGTGREQKWIPEDVEIVNNLRAALTRKSPGADVESVAKLLRTQRIGPLLRHLEGVRRLYVAAVNEMAGIPIELLTPEYTVSYLPSGTFLARLPKKSDGPASLLAIGDPIYEVKRGENQATAALPPGGLLINQVAPGSPAARAQLRPGDVILKYGDITLESVDELRPAIAERAGAKEIAIRIWRLDSETGKASELSRTVPPGPLGIGLAAEPARVAIENRRKLDEKLFTLRDGKWKDLPGSRYEIAQISRLFGAESKTLVDSAASEQTIEFMRRRGDLAKYRYLHFATHGEANDAVAFESSLILSQDKLSKGDLPRNREPLLDGKLTANEVLNWRLDAHLVTLSACETAIGRIAGGDGMLGFAQAFLVAGSRSVCLSLWKVDDVATALLMTRFYQNLLGKREGLAKPMPKSAALKDAKDWLRNLTVDEAMQLGAAMTKGVVRGDRGPIKVEIDPTLPKPKKLAKSDRMYADPRFWAAFILIGDPD